MQTIVVSEFSLPGMEQAIDAACPGARLVVLDGAAPVPAEIAGDVLLLTARGTPRLREILAAMRGLRWLHLLGTGVDAFPVAEIPDRVQLSCSRGASAVPIAEWVMACLLAFEKDLPARWVSAPPETWWLASLGTLAGRTLGLAGFGGIGQAIARRARAFDMEIVALARRSRAQAPEGVRMVGSRAELLAASDHLVLALPSTPATRHFIDREALGQVRRGVHLVNIARGALVDQEALREALDDGRVARASLDVMEPEPLPAGHWLYWHERARLSAHVSWSAPDAFAVLQQAFFEELARYGRGEPLAGVVDRAAGY